MKFSSFADILDTLWRGAVLHALVLLLLILNVISFSYPLVGTVDIPFFLMALYYWGIYRPTLLPVWLVFVYGAALDLIGGQPLGLNTLLFLGLQWLVIDQRRFFTGQPFLTIWFGFALFSLGYGILKWLVFSAIYMTLLYSQALWISIFLNIGLFPAVYMLLHLTHKIVPQAYGKLGT